MTRILIDNDCNLIVEGLRLALDESQFVNDAVLVFTLIDVDAELVPDAVQLPLQYVAASDGDYVGVIPGTLDLQQASYLIVIESSNYNLRFQFTLPAVVRGA